MTLINFKTHISEHILLCISCGKYSKDSPKLLEYAGLQSPSRVPSPWPGPLWAAQLCIQEAPQTNGEQVSVNKGCDFKQSLNASLASGEWDLLQQRGSSLNT